MVYNAVEAASVQAQPVWYPSVAEASQSLLSGQSQAALLAEPNQDLDRLCCPVFCLCIRTCVRLAGLSGTCRCTSRKEKSPDTEGIPHIPVCRRAYMGQPVYGRHTGGCPVRP